MRELALMVLEAAGFEVYAAEDGEAGLDMIPVVKPDLVLLDVVLPGISGLEVLRTLRHSGNTRGIKVVLFTALGSEVTLMLDEGDKPDDIVLKPFNNKLLVEKVRRLI